MWYNGSLQRGLCGSRKTERNGKTVQNRKKVPTATVRYAFVRSLPIMAGYLILGAGFGILLRANGFGLPWAAAMSVFIYAGSMQFVAIDLLSAGASLITTALMTLAVNARHLVYGVSMLSRYRGTGRFKPYLIFSLTDETYSVVCSGELPVGVDGPLYFFLLSLFNQLYWVAGSLIGSAAGSILPISTEGIDFSMTALFVVVFLEQWQSTKKHFSACLGVIGSLICLLIFGESRFIIPAMLVIVGGLCLARPRTTGGDSHG